MVGEWEGKIIEKQETDDGLPIVAVKNFFRTESLIVTKAEWNAVELGDTVTVGVRGRIRKIN